MALEDDVFGESEEGAELADFVFEEVAEGFDEFEAELFGETADVVVEFDVGGAAPGFAAGDGVAGFDDVGVEGALGEEGLSIFDFRFSIFDLGGFSF